MFLNVCINHLFIMITTFWVALEVGGHFFVPVQGEALHVEVGVDRIGKEVLVTG